MCAKCQEAVDVYVEAVNKLPSHYAPQSLYNMLGMLLSPAYFFCLFTVSVNGLLSLDALFSNFRSVDNVISVIAKRTLVNE